MRRHTGRPVIEVEDDLYDDDRDGTPWWQMPLCAIAFLVMACMFLNYMYNKGQETRFAKVDPADVVDCPGVDRLEPVFDSEKGLIAEFEGVKYLINARSTTFVWRTSLVDLLKGEVNTNGEITRITSYHYNPGFYEGSYTKTVRHYTVRSSEESRSNPFECGISFNERTSECGKDVQLVIYQCSVGRLNLRQTDPGVRELVGRMDRYANTFHGLAKEGVVKKRR